MAGPEEIEAVRRWRSESPENERWYQGLATVWEATERSSTPDPRPPRAERVIALAERSRIVGGSVARGAELRPSFVRAAIVGALVAAGVLIGRFSPRAEAVAAVEISTGPNELTNVRLPDGSLVRLAPNSTLRVDRAAGGRRIRLEGRAFFAVVEDRSVPFVVQAGIGEVVVLGTWFQVDASPDELGVLVIDGRVKLETAAGEVEIDQGQRSRAVSGEAPYVEDLPDLRPELAWMEGLLVFHDTPFDQAVTAIEDRYGVTFRLGNESLGDRTLSASFTTEDLETVLSIVCRVIDVTCTLEGSVVTISE